MRALVIGITNAAKQIAVVTVIAVSVGFAPVAAAEQEPLRLRADVAASGPLVTLGDVFENAGAASSRPIGPAPRPGASASFLPSVVQNAVRASGLDWTPPDDLRQIRVRAGAASSVIDTNTSGPSRSTAIAIRKGDLVTLSYEAPGVRITARTRAQSDAAAGSPVRLTNLQSNRTLDAVAVGPGRATANFDHAQTE